MNEESSQSEKKSNDAVKIGIAAVAAVIILTGITILAYQYAKQRSSSVVLPGGTTYLGPGQEEEKTQAPTAPLRFTITATTKWTEKAGNIYPYTFSHPETLPLVVFPNDITDSVAVAWGNIPPQNNIMFRVSDINRAEPTMIEYINQPKINYVNNWWRQYSGLKGVDSVEELVNTKGMQGYRVKYIDTADQTLNDTVFFEVPGRTDLMVFFNNGSLEKSIYDRIIDSFWWDETEVIKNVTVGEPTLAPEPVVQEGTEGQPPTE